MNKLQPSSRRRPLKLLVSVIAVTTLAGCASFSNDGGFGSVEQTTRERLNKDVKWARSDAEKSALKVRVGELLAKPLTIDDAIQVALYNNRGLQAAFFDLGISEAELVQAGRLPNPHFSMLRASKPENGIREYKIEQALTFNIFALITMPLAVEVEKRNFAQTQRLATIEVARLAAETRQAYFTAVAADESVRYMRKVKQAAEAGAELARRMALVGNFSKLRQAREQAFYADAALNLARAEQSAVSARERLARVLGVAERSQMQLPDRLPDLPKEANELGSLEQQALDQRLDLQAIRLETEALAKNLGLTQATRFINVLEVGPARVLEGERNSGYKKGYEISFELPIFDWGGAKVAKAESVYMQAVERAAEVATNARSEVREAYHAYRTNYDIARHYRDEIVPLNKRISDESMLRYNGMLIGVFELLADARSQIGSVNSYIETLRDFWIAQGDLEMSLIGKPSLNAATRASIAATGRADH
ncbi:TolC family protein [Azonexus fungiphilus]|uniref:TolC family protein n=1 Tax=Azonexus fungiphilus TaxID=146940 RepID=UPI00156BC733|nr:TolC family protein [Azonexus fungiphilus]NHC08289.1 TolC family protein [Azonexus fungiphilus]